MGQRSTEALPLEQLGPIPTYASAPVVVFWETTRACALKCLHCRAVPHPRRHPLELSTSEGFRLLDELSTFAPRPIVVLTGGDPFMRPDLFDLLSYGLQRGLRMSLSPSVTRLVTPQVLQRLREVGLARLSFSLDGASPEVHDSFRGVRGSFSMTLARLHDALEAGLALQVHTTVTRHNLKDLPRIAGLLSRLPRIVLWDLFFLVPTGRGRRNDVITAQEHEDVYHLMYDLSRTLPFGTKATLGQHYRRVVLQRAAREGKDLKDAWKAAGQGSSNDGKGVCFVSHVGDVFPSGFLPVLCGNVRRESVVQIYQDHPVFQALRDPGSLKGKCGRCPFRVVCGGCRARAFAYTGDYLAPEPCCVFEPGASEALPSGGASGARLPETARSAPCSHDFFTPSAPIFTSTSRRRGENTTKIAAAATKGGPMLEQKREESPVVPVQSLVSDDGLFLVDSSQRVVHWSDSAQRILGYGPEEVLGKHCYEVIRGRDSYNFRFCRPNCPVIENARRGRSTPNYDLLCTTSDGEARYLNMSTAIVKECRGSFHVLHLFRDVTARRKSEEFARKASTALRKLFGENGEAKSALAAQHNGAPQPRLSRRETEVLRLLAAGMTTQKIAEALNIRPITARNHVARVLAKLGVENRLQAVVYASHHGLI